MAWQPQPEAAIQILSTQALPGLGELAQVRSASVLARSVKGMI